MRYNTQITYKRHEMDIYNHVDRQPDKSAYIKSLIRADMVNGLQHHPTKHYTPNTYVPVVEPGNPRAPAQTKRPPVESEPVPANSKEDAYISSVTGKSFSAKGG